MSKTSEQVLIELREKEENQVPSASGQAKMMTQSEYELKKLKELEAYKADRKLQTMPAVQGIVTEIKEFKNKYGYRYMIVLDGQSSTRYYFNCKSESTVHRMFKVGQKAAFTCTTKTSKSGNKVAVVDMVFYTFA